MKLPAITIAMCAAMSAAAQASPQPAEDKEAAYVKAVTERSAKIVAALSVEDTLKFIRVRDIIACQYRDLNAIHDERNAKVKALKEKGGEDRDAKAREAEAEADAKLYAKHNAYVAKLASELTPEQVDRVKDGMTYGVAPLTYRVQCEMIPALTDEQKRYILAALLEAREYAMDAESSGKKHEWFGKYKGRINNYLSAQGYDLKKERAEWERRAKLKAEN
jgi:Skp family chaperone for outer membrane proteins